MSILCHVLIWIFLAVLFFLFHSLMASESLKSRILISSGKKALLYRLFYSVSSLMLLVVLFEAAPDYELVLYDLKAPWDLILLGFQTLSLIGLFWSLSYLGIKRMLGIDQAFQYFRGGYRSEFLRTKGPYHICRHPIYLFSILFLSIRPTMDLFYAVCVSSAIAYFYVGSFFEEKKLIRKFGKEYEDYQARVPRIFPLKFKA